MNNTLTIKVPERFSDNFGDPFNQILIVINLLNQQTYWDEIIVDFSQNKFVVPHYIGPLSCILKSKSSQGTKLTIISNSSYLNTICFPNGIDINSSKTAEEMENRFIYYKDKTYTPIVHFPTSLLKEKSELRIQMLSALNSILKTQLGLPINVLSAFYYFLDELTQNIVDHSGVDFGTIFAQYYPEKNYLDLSITDAGIGLYQSYINSRKHFPETNAEAINFAVFGKSTKNIPESRGFGLNTTRTMLTKGLKGKFLLMTGNDFFIQTIDREEIIGLKANSNFSGCILSLRIPVFSSESFTIHSYTDL